MNPRWRKPLSAAATAASALVLAVFGCTPANTYAPPPPPEVAVSPPVRRALTTYAEYTGTTRAFAQVDLRARVKGFLKEVRFKEGDEVKAGDVLLVIDEEPFAVRVAEAKAKVDEAEASLKKAEQSKNREIAAANVALDRAALDLAQVEERRNKALLARNAASRDDVDKSEAARKRSAAQVDADEASLAQAKSDFDINIAAARASLESARATLKNAEIDLGYCKITSPIDGRTTRRFVDPGNLVGDGTATVLATVVKDDPIYAYITVSDADVLRFREQVRQGKRVDFRKETIPVDLGMPTETGYPHRGRIEYADPGADPGTGTVTARALFDNTDHVIAPGLFVRVRVPSENRPDALLVPERAVGLDQAGNYVLVIGPKDVVVQKPVRAGSRADDGMRLIESGLDPDDLVVVSGLQRARPGATVKPVREPAPGAAGKPAADKPAEKPAPEKAAEKPAEEKAASPAK